MSGPSTSPKTETLDLDQALAQLFNRMIDEMMAAGIGVSATLDAVKALKLDDIVDPPDDPI